LSDGEDVKIARDLVLLADNFLLFEHRQKSQEFPEILYGQFRINSILRFLAKNSNARYAKYPRIRGIGRPRFLAKIPRVLYKLSFKGRIRS